MAGNSSSTALSGPSTEIPLHPSSGWTGGTLLMKLVEIVGIPVENPDALPYVLMEMDKNEVLIKPSSFNPKAIQFQHRAIFDVSRQTHVEISIYSPNDSKNDSLIGSLHIKPSFLDQKPQDEWFQLTTFQTEKNVLLRIQMLFKSVTF